MYENQFEFIFCKKNNPLIVMLHKQFYFILLLNNKSEDYFMIILLLFKKKCTYHFTLKNAIKFQMSVNLSVASKICT